MPAWSDLVGTGFGAVDLRLFVGGDRPRGLNSARLTTLAVILLLRALARGMRRRLRTARAHAMHAAGTQGPALLCLLPSHRRARPRSSMTSRSQHLKISLSPISVF